MLTLGLGTRARGYSQVLVVDPRLDPVDGRPHTLKPV